jgi:hypothetical protein
MRWVVLALVGAAICTACDHLHVVYGVLWYPQPIFWQQAWWVAPLMASASLVLVWAAEPVRRALGGGSLGAQGLRGVLGDGVAFVAAYVFTSFGHGPDAVLGILVAFWLARAVRSPGWVVVYTILTAIGGCLVEAALSRAGLFHYRHPDHFGVPRWLPGIYLHAGYLTATISSVLRR